MKLLYICECCDEVVDNIELPDRLPDSIVSRLTETEAMDIIKKGGGQDSVVLPTLCDDCREMMYGGPDNNFFSGPALH